MSTKMKSMFIAIAQAGLKIFFVLPGRSKSFSSFHSTILLVECIPEWFSLLQLNFPCLACVHYLLTLTAIRCNTPSFTNIVALSETDQLYMNGASVQVHCATGYQVAGTQETSFYATCSASGVWIGHQNCEGEWHLLHFLCSTKRVFPFRLLSLQCDLLPTIGQQKCSMKSSSERWLRAFLLRGWKSQGLIFRSKNTRSVTRR